MVVMFDALEQNYMNKWLVGNVCSRFSSHIRAASLDSLLMQMAKQRTLKAASLKPSAEMRPPDTFSHHGRSRPALRASAAYGES